MGSRHTLIRSCNPAAVFIASSRSFVHLLLFVVLVSERPILQPFPPGPHLAERVPQLFSIAAASLLYTPHTRLSSPRFTNISLLVSSGRSLDVHYVGCSSSFRLTK